MSLIIRPSIPEDFEALVSQFEGLNAYEDGIVGNRRTDRNGAIESLAVAQQRVMETDGTVLVAERSGHVVGHLFATVENDAIFVRPELRGHLYISELFVNAKERRSGVAAALLNEAERFASTRGLTRLFINVLTGNTDAQIAYQRLGLYRSR